MKIIPLTRNKETIVDDEDFGWLSRWNWYLQGSDEIIGYAVIHPKKHGPIYYMHRLIAKLMFDLTDDLECDHINGNSLDNRRENIRVVTHHQNMMNTKKRKGTSSKYKGVCWQIHRKTWNAYIQVDTKRVHLGVFKNEIDAAKTYDEAAKEHYGEFARLNFPYNKDNE